MFYYNPDEFTNRLLDREFIMYSEKDFERLVNWQYDEEGDTIKPFREDYNKKFLKDTWNIEFVSDDDWYSIYSPEEGRFSLSGLSKEMKYALTLLHFSSKGRMLSFKSCSERIWKALSDMPFDILVAVDTSKIESWKSICLGVDYIIENLPFDDEFLQVNVLNSLIRDKDKITDKNGLSLYVEDDKYFACVFNIKRHFAEYDWKKHLNDIIKHANSCVREEYPIIDKTLVCDVVEYAKVLDIDEDYFLDLNDYTYYLNQFERLLKDGDITQEVYDTEMSKYKIAYRDDYKQYLWVKDKLKIYSHLYTIPDRRVHRKLPMLIIDKYPNDSYKIWGKLTVKYPEFYEIVYDVIKEFYTEDCERYITVVDVEEAFSCASNISDVDCGFKITENRIDIFDRNDALKQFIDIAQEAISSNNCEISTEYY